MPAPWVNWLPSPARYLMPGHITICVEFIIFLILHITLGNWPYLSVDSRNSPTVSKLHISYFNKFAWLIWLYLAVLKQTRMLLLVATPHAQNAISIVITTLEKIKSAMLQHSNSRCSTLRYAPGAYHCRNVWPCFFHRYKSLAFRMNLTSSSPERFGCDW